MISFDFHHIPKLSIGFNYDRLYTGWPRKNATSTINDLRKTRDGIKKLCALLGIKFFHSKMTLSLILIEVFWFHGRFSEAVLFSIFATAVSKVTTDVPKICHCLASPGNVSALALKNEDSMNKEKHSLRNIAALQSGGSYSKKFLPTSIMTFDTKEANFENDIASENWL